MDTSEDKSIRIAHSSYKILTTIKKDTGKPIKRIISDLLVEHLFGNKKKK